MNLYIVKMYSFWVLIWDNFCRLFTLFFDIIIFYIESFKIFSNYYFFPFFYIIKVRVTKVMFWVPRNLFECGSSGWAWAGLKGYNIYSHILTSNRFHALILVIFSWIHKKIKKRKKKISWNQNFFFVKCLRADNRFM